MRDGDSGGARSEAPSFARLATLQPLRSLDDVWRLLEQASPEPDEMPCLNPHCQNLCRWPAKGRPPFYCSKPCKDYCTSERRRLAQEIGILEEQLGKAVGDGVKHRRVRSALARKRWLLLHYLRSEDMYA